MPVKQNAAVLSADVVDSSAMSTGDRKKLQTELNKFYRYAGKEWPGFKMQQFRGDSLQATITSDYSHALRIALSLQSYLIRSKINIRMAVGVGTISFRGKDIVSSDGSAFRASGPYLDMLRKNNELISVAGDNEEFTSEWQTHSASLNFIISRWSAPQAEAIHLQLQGHTQQQIAKKLKIKQPSVNQRLQGAGWFVVYKILERFESVQLIQ